MARLQLIYFRYSYNSSMLFAAGSTQDPDDSEQVIADVDQGGLGMPDRDYYIKEDAKSKETREHYLQHVQKVFELIGDDPVAAKQNAETVMRLETAMAKASLTRVERRDPHKLVHKMKVADLIQLAPNFDWIAYYQRDAISGAWHSQRRRARIHQGTEHAAGFRTARELEILLALPCGRHSPRRTFLRNSSRKTSTSIASICAGAKEMQPRWKRCVQYVDYDLGEALGQVYVAQSLLPGTEAEHGRYGAAHRGRDGRAHPALDWMSPETKQQALTKLAGIRNKIGYPDKWRDYSSVKIVRDDFCRQRRARASVREPPRHQQNRQARRPWRMGHFRLPPWMPTTIRR